MAEPKVGRETGHEFSIVAEIPEIEDKKYEAVARALNKHSWSPYSNIYEFRGGELRKFEK